MQITLRIYRTHDYDLMALHRCGALNFPKAARRALIAYYKKERLLLSTDTSGRKVPDDLPAMMEFNINIGEHAAPGFTAWFHTVKRGYRNNLVKNILRASLDGLCTELYMPEERRLAEGSDHPQPISLAVKERKPQNTAKQPKHPKVADKAQPQEAGADLRDDKPAQSVKLAKPVGTASAAQPRTEADIPLTGTAQPDRDRALPDAGNQKQPDVPRPAISFIPIQPEPPAPAVSDAEADDDFDAFDSFEDLMRRR